MITDYSDAIFLGGGIQIAIFIFQVIVGHFKRLAQLDINSYD